MLRNFISKTKQQFTQIKLGTSVLIDQTKKAALLRQQPTLDRAGFRLVEQNRQDLKALLPFVLVTIFLPELLPLMILKGRVPTPMVTPEQLVEKRAKLITRRIGIAQKYTNFKLESATLEQLRECNEYFGLQKYQLPWNYRTTLNRYLEYLAKDDEYLLNSAQLSDKEMFDVYFERGLYHDSPTKTSLIQMIRERKKLSKSDVLQWTFQEFVKASENRNK